MLDFLKKYLITGYLKFENNAINFGVDKLVFYFVPHILFEYRKLWPIFKEKWGAAIFLAGRDMGFQFFDKHGVSHNKSMTEVFVMSFDVLGSFGWGNFKTLKVDEEKQFMVMVGASTLAQEHKKIWGISDHPIDFLLSGLTAGALKYLTKKQIFCVELKCCSEKDVQNCLFVTGTKENITAYVKEYSPEKLDWTNKILSEIEELDSKGI